MSTCHGDRSPSASTTAIGGNGVSASTSAVIDATVSGASPSTAPLGLCITSTGGSLTLRTHSSCRARADRRAVPLVAQNQKASGAPRPDPAPTCTAPNEPNAPATPASPLSAPAPASAAAAAAAAAAAQPSWPSISAQLK